MFKRITYEEWAMVFVVISFILVTGVFILSSIRVFLIPKATRERLASLPLEPADSPSTHNPITTPSQP
jgi:hypothetical protein